MGCAAANRSCAAFVVAVAALLAPTAGHAALIGSCTILVLSSGQMTPNAAIAVLGSAQPGGTAAQAQVTANSLVCTVLGLLDCFRVSAPAPTAFTTYPSGGGAGVTFSTSYRIDGGAGIAGSVQTEVLNGTHTVAVDLAATRGSGVFPAGVYQAQVTVRCE
jgi:hypothetical protein